MEVDGSLPFQEIYRWSMKWDLYLTGLVLTIIILQGSVVQADDQGKKILFVSVMESENKVFLTCNDTKYSWKNEKETLHYNNTDNKPLNLGKQIQDPRGIYQCFEGENNSPFLHVYYRMCQNCVEINSGSLIGILIADIIATVILAIGVYCFAGHQVGYLPAAFDKQIRMDKDQLYQPLRDRDDNSYSHIGGKRPRNK